MWHMDDEMGAKKHFYIFFLNILIISMYILKNLNYIYILFF